MNSIKIKAFAMAAVLGVSLFSASGAFAWCGGGPYRRPYPVRAVDPRVNTRFEHRWDANHNGRIGPWERYRISHRGVNTPREFYCDRNHNGRIGPYETRCL